MNTLQRYSRGLPWLMALAVSAVAVGCGGGGGGGGRDPILGGGADVTFTPPSGAVAPGATCPTAGASIPTVMQTDPSNGNLSAPTSTLGVANNGKLISASFNLAMNPATISAASFSLAPVNGALLTPASVSYNTVTQVASLSTSSALLPNTNYTAVIQSTAASAAGTAIGCPYVWTFKTAAAAAAGPTAGPALVNLGAAATFAGFGGRATLTNDGLKTVINGDIGVDAASTKITGLRDTGGNVYTVTTNNDGMVNGTIYTLTAPPGSVAGAKVTQARIDALLAFNALSPASLPGGIDESDLAQCPSCGGAGQGPGQLAGRTLPPGVYKSKTGTYGIGITAPTAGNLTLDAQGNTNAVWVFQAAAGTGSLTVGVTGPATPAAPIQVLLINGAQAKNVFWYAPAGATIGTGATMVGTILADASITLSTTGGSPPTAVITTLNGRAIALTAGVTMTNTVITVPAP